jgi:ubiquinone/menaquinone biosynthesis C-methylase UbiE
VIDLILVHRLFVLTLIAASVVSLSSTRTSLAEQEQRALKSDDGRQNAKTDEAAVPPALKVYKGRRIAQTMHYFGAEWLIRANRENQERCSVMLAQLGVKRGMTVCDMGCGNGFYALQIAKIVGPQGSVLCVDIQPEMLQFLKQRAAEREVTNYKPILGKLHDPRLPPGKVDLILCVDVYHEFSHPVRMLAGMRESLAPGGMVVLLEYRKEDKDVPIKLLHKMSKDQIMKEMPANGFKLVKEFNKLPWQHMMFFGRDDDKTLTAIEPVAFVPDDI